MRDGLAGRRTRAAIEQRAKDIQDDGDVLEADDESILSLVDHDDVSFHDAVEGLTPEDPTSAPYSRTDCGCVCCGEEAFWKSATMSRNFGKLLSIAEFDYETKKLYKLAFPFVLQAAFSGIAWNANIAIVGHLIGTREVTALVIVDLLIGLTGEAVGGIQQSLTSLLSHSIGANSPNLTGIYFQLALELYILISIPIIIMWYFLVEDTFYLLGFDEETAQIGKSFAIPFMFGYMVRGVLKCVHSLLDVTGRQLVSTILVAVWEGTYTISLLIYALYWSPTLEAVGLLYLIILCFMLWANVTLIIMKGWYAPYYSGMFGTFALTVRSDRIYYGVVAGLLLIVLV